MSESEEIAPTLAEIQAAVRTLPPKEQELFYLSRSDRLSFAEIAERQGISVGQVERRLANILGHIRREIGRARKRGR